MMIYRGINCSAVKPLFRSLRESPPVQSELPRLQPWLRDCPLKENPSRKLSGIE